MIGVLYTHRTQNASLFLNLFLVGPAGPDPGAGVGVHPRPFWRPDPGTDLQPAFFPQRAILPEQIPFQRCIGKWPPKPKPRTLSKHPLKASKSLKILYLHFPTALK